MVQLAGLVVPAECPEIGREVARRGGRIGMVGSQGPARPFEGVPVEFACPLVPAESPQVDQNNYTNAWATFGAVCTSDGTATIQLADDGGDAYPTQIGADAIRAVRTGIAC